MTFKQIVNTIFDIVKIKMVDEEEGDKLIKEFSDEFNEKYQNIPKEQWCVMFYMPWEDGEPNVTGPFDSEEEAKLFIAKWEERRAAYIEQYLKENPNKDEYDIPSGPCLKAKKLTFNEKNEEIINEIRRKENG